MGLKKDQKIKLAVLAALIIGWTAFIFFSSMKSSAESSNESGFFAQFLYPIFGEMADLVVRKFAHFAEFFILSSFVAVFSLKLFKYIKVKIFGYAMFYTLLVAVCDEFIQNFTGRGSSVVDVMIDFGGAATGFIVFWLTGYLINKFGKNGRSTT